MSQHIRRRRSVHVGFLIALSTIAVACGSDDPSSEVSTAATTTAATPTTSATLPDPTTVDTTGGDAVFPRTLATALGDVTIDEAPVRVVTLGNVDADIVVGLGVTPVAVVANEGFETGMAPWLEAALGEAAASVEQLDGANGLPVEAIAAAAPDLIIAGSSSFDIAESYEQLSAIAPVVSYLDEPFTDTWQDRAALVGAALGRDAAATVAVSDLEADLDGRRAAHADWIGRSFVFGIHFDGSTRLITSPTDSTLRLFTDTFGLVVPPAVEALGDDLNGTADIGPEQLDLLDADALLLTFFTPDDQSTLEASPLFQAVPAVGSGGFQTLDIATATALREASILAIPYAAAALETALTAALG